jgi:putative transcriptional regulator
MKRQVVMRPGWALLLLAVVILGSWPRLRAAVDRLEEGQPSVHAGDLLVARPGGVGPLFAGTVILMLAFDEERHMGVVVNRAATHPWASYRWGGPVPAEVPITVVQARSRPPGATALGHDLYWLEGDLDWPDGALRQRVYVGYAGWAPGQLEEEIRRGAWSLRPARPDLVFGDDGEDTWLVALGETLR